MKKGFTLIELLAVIVILAIIALIAVPSIMGIITKVKRGAAEDSAYNYIKAVETSAVTSQLNGETLTGNYDVSELKDKILLKGTKPSNGSINLANIGKVEPADLCINGFEVSYDGAYASVEANNCDNVSSSTNVVYANGTAVYFNPVTGAKCTAGESVSTSGTKTGCMKWYIFNDGGTTTDTINLILNHNTTAKLAWNSTGSNVSGPTNVMTQLASDTSTWAGVPTRSDSYSVSNGTATYTINYSTYKARLITAAEIAQITGNSEFNEATTPYTSWFYFDSNNRTQTATTAGASNYDWLFDYTYNCTSYGCNMADASNWGYWTSTAISGLTSDSWRVISYGSLSNDYVGVDSGFGVRPVITILKSNL